MDTFVAWLQATSLSQAIVFKTWIWPPPRRCISRPGAGHRHRRLFRSAADWAFPRVPIAALAS